MTLPSVYTREPAGANVLGESSPEVAIAMESPYLSVLIPAYNEEGTIELVLRRVLELGSILKEVVLVDDGSTDRTATVYNGP
jgi:cellulose synthase/poly-beta-1,6-N-acetylglucosamine synthase-like glycosyltransferase